MPDPTPAPPAPTPANKPKRPRSIANRAFLNEIDDSRKVAAAASDPANTAALADVEFDATLVARLTQLADDTEAEINRTTGARGDTLMTAREQATARDHLLAALAPIQTAAKRKFKGDQESQRTAYGIAEPLATMEFDLFVTICAGVLARLTPDPGTTPPTPPQDVLPGIKPDPQIAALADAVAACGGKKQEHTDHQGIAGKLLEKVKTDIATLAALRHETQLAADQTYPWRTLGVAATRKTFLLPEDRPIE